MSGVGGDVPTPNCVCGHGRAEHHFDDLRAASGYPSWCAECSCRRYLMPPLYANYADPDWVAHVHDGVPMPTTYIENQHTEVWNPPPRELPTVQNNISNGGRLDRYADAFFSDRHFKLVLWLVLSLSLNVIFVLILTGAWE